VIDMSYYAVRLVEELAPDGESSTWYAEHPELLGCHAVAATAEEAQNALDRSREAWLQYAADAGVPIPQAQDGPSVVVLYAIRPKTVQAKATDADVASRSTYEVRAVAA
jgi:predicted RNase H-like HicB family nuclease